jgi:hypothetical protein
VGVYLVSVDADNWANDELMIAVRADLATALSGRRVADYQGPDEIVSAGEGDRFEEKLYRDQTGFV